MSAPVIVAYPTVMDGLVLRWYADEDAYRRLEACSASRNRAYTGPDCPAEWQRQAQAAHELLAAGREDEARAVATHRPTGLMSDHLERIR